MLTTEELGLENALDPGRWSRIRAFLRILTLTEWAMGLLTLLIAAIGASGVFLVIQGTPTGLAGAMASAASTAEGLLDSAVSRKPAPGHTALNPAKQAKTPKKPLKIEDRAWVEIGGIEKGVTPPDPMLGAHFRYGISPRNIGKSVANDVLTLVQEASDGAGLMANKRSIKVREDRLYFEPRSTQSGMGSSTENPGPESLPPGGQSAAPIYAGGAEPKRLSTGGFVYSYILGRIDYIDVFGAPHWTHFCFYVLNAQGELAPCQYGNDQDNFPEPLT